VGQVDPASPPPRIASPSPSSGSCPSSTPPRSQNVRHHSFSRLLPLPRRGVPRLLGDQPRLRDAGERDWLGGRGRGGAPLEALAEGAGRSAQNATTALMYQPHSPRFRDSYGQYRDVISIFLVLIVAFFDRRTPGTAKVSLGIATAAADDMRRQRLHPFTPPSAGLRRPQEVRRDSLSVSVSLSVCLAV